MKSSDRIEKVVALKAPVARVWRAIADSAEFGRWFGVTLEGPFVEGQTVRGTFDELPPPGAMEKAQQSLGLPPSPVKYPEPSSVFCTVVHIEPERSLSFRWIPYGIDAAIDPASEPTTLVELRLEPSAGGTLLTIVESGFDSVPAHRRERAFRMNDSGWTEQTKRVAAHVQGT